MGYQNFNTWFQQPSYFNFSGSNPSFGNNQGGYGDFFAGFNNFFAELENYFGNYNTNNSADSPNLFGGNNTNYFCGCHDGHHRHHHAPQQPTNPTNPVNPANHTVKTELIEVGYTNGKADQHAQSVMDIYKKNNPQGQNNVEFMGLDDENDNASNNLSASKSLSSSTEDSSNPSEPLNNKQDLDNFIDGESSGALNVMADKVNQIVKRGDTEVINGSLGFSRDNVYEDVLMALKNNPNLATNMGLQASDITSLETNDQGQTLVTPEVADAISTYVDQRMDQNGSAYQKSLNKYQAATKNAADQGVTVVVAAGNEHDLNDVFSGHRLGGDTNFLAQSDYVISVAATDDNGTSSLNDDQVASFSSRGDGRFNPTVSAKGVGVSTPFGAQDGTSFAAPQVAALVARMKQENPNLTFAQIKDILQRSATDIDPSSTLTDGAGEINTNLALQWAQ
jgi:hypothetical protein